MNGPANLFSSLRGGAVVKSPTVHPPDTETHQWSSEARRLVSRRVVWAALVLLTVAALALRLRLLERPMRYDEAFTVWRYAENGWRVAISDYSLPNNHVMHTLAVSISGRMFGFGPAVVRTPALVVGVALVPMGYLAARRLAGRAAGLLAAALLAVSATMVDASAEARGYTMAAFAALAAVWLGSHVRACPHNRLAWAGLVAAGAFGLWTVPVFAYPLAAMGVWLAWPQSGRPRFEMLTRTVVPMAGIGALTAVLYRPVLVSDPGALVANRFVTPDPFPQFLAALPDLVARVAAAWTWLWWAPATLVLVVGGVAALVPDARRPEVFRLAVAGAGGPAAVLLVHHALPYPRNFLPLYPLAIVLASAGLARFRPTAQRGQVGWLAVVAGLIAVIGAPSLSLGGTDQPPDRNDQFAGAAETARFLADRIGPNDRIAAPIPASAPLRYYLLLEGIDPPPNGNQNIYLVIPDSRTLQDGIDAAGVALPAAPRQVSRVVDGTIYLASALPG